MINLNKCNNYRSDFLKIIQDNQSWSSLHSDNLFIDFLAQCKSFSVMVHRVKQPEKLQKHGLLNYQESPESTFQIFSSSTNILAVSIFTSISIRISSAAFKTNSLTTSERLLIRKNTRVTARNNDAREREVDLLYLERLMSWAHNEILIRF